MKKVIVLGGDGFCGWPTSLHLSKLGADVVIVDNLSRRSIDIELEIESLTPIRHIGERIRAWEKLSDKKISYSCIDLAHEYDRLLELVRSYKPDVIVHFAEQRAAPYSMKSARTKTYTVNNNVAATHNLLAAVVESELSPHIVHLGTMGVYGYGSAGMKIPEGYLNITVPLDNDKSSNHEILYPVNPGSVYHLTKTLDQLLFAFYNKNDNVRITDLHQGIVWGTQTELTSMSPELINRFDYDGDYGTVLNRFLMQSAVGYPLSVHGTGGQTRAFIHIRDTVRCIELAIENPPASGDRVKIYNQMTETHSVRDLANIVSRVTGASIAFVKNPRMESAENELFVENSRFLSEGLDPTTLQNGLLKESTEIAKRYIDRCDVSKIPCTSYWNEDVKNAATSDSA